jgi:5-methylcytosine-specific restriction endonuclease McrA
MPSDRDVQGIASERFRHAALVSYDVQRIGTERFLREIEGIDALFFAGGMSSEARDEARRRAIIRRRRILSAPPAELPYDEFLDSPYWIGLSEWLKQSVAWRCRRRGCGRFLYRGLQVHHKTYAHRGLEYPDHLDDLEVLCPDCHKQTHGLKDKEQLNAGSD